MPYLTKTQLTKRWSRDLVDFYFPIPTEIKVNPKNSRYAEMRLYDVYRVMEIEHLETFKKDWRKVLERRYKRLINKQLDN